MNRWNLEYHIQKLKSKDDRFFYGLAISCLTDVVLAAFYFLQTFGFNGGLWRFSNTVYYILLLAGKVNLLVLGRREGCLGNACKAASILLILTGIFAMSRTYQYVKMEKVLPFSRSIYILNGTILILRMLIQPILRVFPKKTNIGEPVSTTHLLGDVRRGYTWTENLIAFSLLFTNLIVIYEWGKDEALLLSNILQGQAIGLIILGIGIALLRKSNKEFKAKETQIFSGLLRCADCGCELRFSHTKATAGQKGKRYHMCTTHSRYSKSKCSNHYISYEVIYDVVLGRLQYWISKAHENGDEFFQLLLKNSDKQKDEEQLQLESKKQELQAKLDKSAQDIKEAEKWLTLVCKYTELTELTAPLLNELIDKIVVHQAAENEDGSRTQEIEIFYQFVGKID